MSSLFQRVAGAHPGRSVFNLSYSKKLTCDMGQLIPVMCDEVVPGDVFKIGNECVVRFQPLIAPVMHEINVYVHYFFVPYRILWDDWETFITGGPDGNDTAAVLPRWQPASAPQIGSLWDYMGLPIDVIPVGRYPLDFPRRAYVKIFNDYYRDETLMPEIDITTGNLVPGSILNRCWEKDYFTSALPFQQRGTAPSLPISGTGHAIWPASLFAGVTAGTASEFGPWFSTGGAHTNDKFGVSSINDLDGQHTRALFNANDIDFGNAVTFDVTDLRLVFQIQKWMERNARAGARYTEFLQSHFGVSPRDERLQRAEYIGGSKSPVIFSEVLQTSQSDASGTAQGNMAGHGISVNQSMCANYRATEFGLIMGIMSIMPRTGYQQGINRQWLRQTKYDFYFPEFANLSEQGIENAEIWAQGTEAANTTIFGYQGRYDEMRYKPNQVCGNMRSGFDYWHLSRKFTSPPLLNQSFVQVDPTTLKRIFAVQDEPGLVVNFGNLIKAIRPMPIQATPGLIDHN